MVLTNGPIAYDYMPYGAVLTWPTVRTQLQQALLHHFAQIFVRGGILLVTADSPQRAVLLCAKCPNASTRRPCSQCLLKQSEDVDDEENELGDRNFDTDGFCRTRAHTDAAQQDMRDAPTKTASAAISVDTGVNLPSHEDSTRPLFDTCKLARVFRQVPPEAMHADALVSSPAPLFRN